MKSTGLNDSLNNSVQLRSDPSQAQRAFIEIVSGRRRGVLAQIVRTGLAACEPIYGAAVAIRNWTFDAELRKPHQASIPIVSVGNLTTGGTGKTPLVHWIVRWLQEKGCSVAVVSRGYRSIGDGPNDEARELARTLPQAIGVENPRRIQAVEKAIAAGGQIAVLDDAFQHRQLARELEIVAIDGVEPWGYGRLLPRGLLREPLGSLRRAHIIVVTRTNLVDREQRASIAATLSRTVPQTPVLWAVVRPTGWTQSDGATKSLEVLHQAKTVAFCGLGQPDSFLRTLQQLNVNVAAWRAFADHHHYTERDLAELHTIAESLKADALVCTLKDLVKIERTEVGAWPLYALVAEHQFLDDPQPLIDRLQQLLPVAAS